MGLSEGIQTVAEGAKTRALDTVKMPIRLVRTAAGAVADSTALAIGRTLKETVIPNPSGGPPAPLTTVVATGESILRRVGRAATKFGKNLVTLHPVRAVTEAVAEFGAGLTETATAVPDVIAGTVNTVRNGVNRVLRGAGRAATGIASLGEDISSAAYTLETNVGSRVGPYNGEPPALAA